jgi:hypothetical protein
MSWYKDDAPAAIVTELEKKIGAKPYIKVIIDPDDRAIAVDPKYDVVSLSPIRSTQELDVEYGTRPTIDEVTIAFNDHDRYFDTANPASVFYQAECSLDRDHTAADQALYLIDKLGFALSAGDVIVINDGTNSEELTVATFTAASGTTYYHTVTTTTGLVNNFSAGASVYTRPITNREMQISLCFVGVTNFITQFTGRILELPQIEPGKATFRLAPKRKVALDTMLTGADTDTTKKLMRVGVSGTLETSIATKDGWGDPPYAWEITSGALPAGVTLDATTGLLSGTPTTAGTYTFTVTISNSDNETYSQEITLVVDDFYNAEMDPGDPAYDLSDYWTFQSGEAYPPYDLTAREGWARVDIQGDYGIDWLLDGSTWSIIDDDSHYMLRAVTQPFCIDCRLDMHTSPANYWVGLMCKKSSSSAMPIFMCLYNDPSNPNKVQGWVNGGTPEDDSYSSKYIDLRIRTTATTAYLYYKAWDATTWTLLKQQATTGYIKAGVFASTSINNPGNRVIADFDWVRIYQGALAISTTAVSQGIIGDAYSSRVYATGGTGGYVFSISAGKMPPGLVMTADGNIQGTPTESGSWTITVTVTDDFGSTDTQDLTIEVSTATELLILPDYPDHGTVDAALSLPMNFIGSATLDRAEITVYSTCPIGAWTIVFTDATNYTVNGPGVIDQAGNKLADLTITGKIKIDKDAWSGYTTTGTTLTFVTGISFAGENPVDALYSILTGKMGLDEKYLDASSAFAAKTVGTLKENATAGSAVTIKVNVSTLTKLTGATLTITQGVTTEDVTVSSQSDKGFPPYTEIVVATLANNYTAGATVTEKLDAAPSALMSYDREKAFCTQNGITISITFERAVTIAQALELIAAHFDGYTYEDNWGRECVHAFRPRYNMELQASGSDLEATEALIKMPYPVIGHVQEVNEIVLEYGYDYSNSSYQYKEIFPGTARPEYISKSAAKNSKTVQLPGLYDTTLAPHMAARRWYFYNDGVRTIETNFDLRAVLLRLGDVLNVDVPYPDFDSNVELCGVEKSLLSGINVKVNSYDWAQKWRDWFVVGVNKIGTAYKLY